MKLSYDLNNFNLKNQQFRDGRILISELHHADYAVQKAKNEYLNSAYELITAQLKLENNLRK